MKETLNKAVEGKGLPREQQPQYVMQFPEHKTGLPRCLGSGYFSSNSF